MEKITALDLSLTLDRFKDEHGNVDHALILKVGKTIGEYGPFYRELLDELACVANLPKAIIIPKKEGNK